MTEAKEFFQIIHNKRGRNATREFALITTHNTFEAAETHARRLAETSPGDVIYMTKPHKAYAIPNPKAEELPIITEEEAQRKRKLPMKKMPCSRPYSDDSLPEDGFVDDDGEE